MATPAAVAQSNAMIAARAELDRCLVRYERLASMPRWMQYPIVGDVAAYHRAHAKHVAQGNGYMAAQLADAISAEERRLALARRWPGRSSAAWLELVRRMEMAIWAARATGLQVAQGTLDRIADAKREMQRALRAEGLN